MTSSSDNQINETTVKFGNVTDNPTGGVDNPKKGYGALGAFIARQAPYSNPNIPNLHHKTPLEQQKILEFGNGSVAGDNDLLNVIDPKMPPEFEDKHVVAIFPEPAVYAAMNRDEPATKVRDGDAMEKEGVKFLKWDFGDRELYRINKAMRIQYTHTLPDGTLCTAFILVGYTGESH